MANFRNLRLFGSDRGNGGISNEELSDVLYSTIADIRTNQEINYIIPSFDNHTNESQSEKNYIKKINNIVFDRYSQIELVCPYVGRKRFRYKIRFRRGKRKRRKLQK